MRTPKQRKDKNERWAGRNWREWPEKVSRFRGRKRKNTKRYCRGKVGVEHTFKEKLVFEWFTVNMYRMECTNCGKHGKWRTERRP